VLALKIWIDSPLARAAASTSRFAENQIDRLHDLAADLVRRQVAPMTIKGHQTYMNLTEDVCCHNAVAGRVVTN
jgi:hypothetical protein